MKTRLLIAAGSLLAALLCPPAMAQVSGMDINTATPGSGMTQGQGMSSQGRMQPGQKRWSKGPRDCSNSRNPDACVAHREARNQAIAACRDTTGNARRQCLRDQMQKVDCGKTANPQRCAARTEAARACQGQVGPALRQCMRTRMPPVDCRQAANPQRCQQHQQARAACQDKVGPEHMNCLRQQFQPK